MRKLKLLLAAFALFGVSATWAEDVTSLITNADFSGSYSSVYTINTNRYIFQPNGWTVDYKNVSTWNMTVVKSTDNMASNFSGTYAVPSDNNRYMVRFRDNQTSEYIDLSQTITIPTTGEYTFSADLIRENGSKITVALYAGDNNVSNSSNDTWENRSFTVNLTAGTEIKVGIKFTNKGADGVKAGADNVKIQYRNINGSSLAGLILQATSINTLTHDLGDAIEDAQNVYDGINDTRDYQATIDEAITTLQSAINASISSIAMEPSKDLTALICNPGFEECTPISENQATGTSIDYASTGWTALSTTTSNSCGAVVEYGSSFTLNNVSAPSADNNSASGKAFGISIGWNATVAYKTPKLTLPAGHYALSVYGYNNNGEGSDYTSKFGFVPTSGDSQLSSKTSFTYNTWETDEVSIVLSTATEGTFQIGGLAGNNTSTKHAKVFLDNITLTYLGNLIQNVKTDMTLGDLTSMTANNWYHLHIEYDGTYSIEASSDASALKYVTDGKLVETTAGTAFSLTDGKQNLKAGHYYIKSSSAQNLTISLDSYDYSLGDVATSLTSGTYIQSLTTLTYTYADAATSNPGASFAILNGSAKVALKKGSTPVAEGTLSLEGKVLTATFSEVTLDKNSTYTLTLPTATIGYAGHVSNSEIELTVNTPYVFNGDYYIKNTAQAKYLTFGSSWGTRTTLDEVGDLHTVTALPDGTYTLQNLNMNDGNNYIKIVDEAGYSNGTSGQAEAFTITSDGDIKLSDGTNYLGSESANKNVVKAASVSANTKWEFITATERDATISGATIAAPIDITYKYIRNPNLADWSKTTNNWTSGGTVAGADHGSYNNGTCVDKNMQHYNNDSFDTYIELTGVPNGVYQFSAAGFYRAGTTSQAEEAHSAGTEVLNAYVYANDNQTPIASIMEGVVAEKYNIKGGESAVTGGYVPNDQPSATFYFWNDKMAINTVTVLVTDGNLRFGMKKDTKIDNDWSVFDNFRLKYFGNSTESVTITAAGLATYVSDNDLDFSGAVGLTAYKATISGDKANLTEVTTVPAGEGVLLIGAAGDYEIPVTTGVAAWDADDNDFIRGAGVAVGDKDYILSYNAEDGKYGFYWAQGAVVPANRAYLSGGSGARLSLVFEGEATGISDVRGKTSDVRNELYDLSGRRVAQPAKGLYIKNGKKVFIK